MSDAPSCGGPGHGSAAATAAIAAATAAVAEVMATVTSLIETTVAENEDEPEASRCSLQDETTSCTNNGRRDDADPLQPMIGDRKDTHSEHFLPPGGTSTGGVIGSSGDGSGGDGSAERGSGRAMGSHGGGA